MWHHLHWVPLDHFLWCALKEKTLSSSTCNLPEDIGSFLLTTISALIVSLGCDDTLWDTSVDVDGSSEASTPIGSSRSTSMAGFKRNK